MLHLVRLVSPVLTLRVVFPVHPDILSSYASTPLLSLVALLSHFEMFQIPDPFAAFGVTARLIGCESATILLADTFMLTFR